MSAEQRVSRTVWFALLLYVFLLACRDIAIEHYLSKESGEPSSLAVTFYVCALIFGTSLCLLLFKKRFGAFATKLRSSNAYGWCALASALTTVIYATTIYMVRGENLGATVFNLLDFGLAPFCIAGVGILFDKARPSRELPLSLCLYIVGMVAMNWAALRAPPGPGRGFLMAIALLSPVATGFSDLLSRRFLKEYDFNQLEVLVVRFSLPTIGIGCYLAARGQHLTPEHLGVASAVAWFLALLPLYILYSVLMEIDLPYLSIWEMLIPALIFFETSFHNTTFRKPETVVGALVILLGYAIYELKALTPRK